MIKTESFSKRNMATISKVSHAFMDQLSDALFVLDHNWRFTYFNAEAEKLLLRKQEDIIGKIVWDEFPEAFRTTFYYEYNKAIREKKQVHFQEFFLPLRTWFDVRAYPTREGLLVHFRDITQEKRELDESRQHYKSLFDHNPDAIYSLDLSGKYLSVNQSFVELFGYSKEDALKMNYNSLIAEEDLEKTNKHFRKAATGEVRNYDITVISKKGERIITNVTNVPIVVNDEIVGVFGIAKDITERVQEKQELCRSKEIHTLISENSQDIISICSPDGIITYITPAVQNLLGYLPEEIIHTTISDYYHPDDISKILNYTKDTNVSRGRIRHKDGNYIWFEINSKIIRNGKGDIEKVLAVVRDISERLQAEALMRKSEKLSLAGQLAAGVAHEIRNPLTAVKGFLQIMQSGENLKKEYLDVMYSEITRIEEIIHELLFLAQPNKLNFAEKNINNLLNHVVTLMGTEAIKENIRIETNLYRNPLIINCEENQIKQLFINLVKNSIEAMPRGGEIVIKSERETSDVKITVSDTGYGIPPETLSKIGQPFYTTKEKGTGLGLAVSNNIIETHHGKMIIDSKLHQGTTFTITFPLAVS
ncbi:MAG: PAS domain S-box protein [Heyndrickxia sp.]